jgi:hypothetical protein
MDQPPKTSVGRAGTGRSASPSAERLAGALGELVAATLAGQLGRAGELLSVVGQRRIDLERRRPVPIAAKLAVHRRDSWTCRYCRARTIAPPVLRFLSEIYPEEFPFHPNWKAGHVHPAVVAAVGSIRRT